MRKFVFSDKFSHINSQNVAALHCAAWFLYLEIYKSELFSKKSCCWYEAKISAADQALLGRELGAPPAQPYQNQPELSPGPHDVHVPSYPTGTRFL